MKKKNESCSFRREYGEKGDVFASPRLAVDTKRASEYADENESVHIKRTEQFQQAVDERKYPSTVFTRQPSSCVTRLHRVDKDEKRSRFEIICRAFREGPAGEPCGPVKIPPMISAALSSVSFRYVSRLRRRQRRAGLADSRT